MGLLLLSLILRYWIDSVDGERGCPLRAEATRGNDLQLAYFEDHKCCWLPIYSCQTCVVVVVVVLLVVVVFFLILCNDQIT